MSQLEATVLQRRGLTPPREFKICASILQRKTFTRCFVIHVTSAFVYLCGIRAKMFSRGGCVVILRYTKICILPNVFERNSQILLPVLRKIRLRLSHVNF
jgi:hypothetical protein